MRRFGEQRGQGDLADADAALAEEVAAGDAQAMALEWVMSVHAQSFGHMHLVADSSAARATAGPGGVARSTLSDLPRPATLEASSFLVSSKCWRSLCGEGSTSMSTSRSCIRRRTRTAAEELSIDAVFDRAADSAVRSSFAEGLGGLDEDGVVQQRQRLQRGVGDLAAGDADFAAGGVEGGVEGEGAVRLVKV